MLKEGTDRGVASQISCVTLARTVSQTKQETEGKVTIFRKSAKILGMAK